MDPRNKCGDDKIFDLWKPWQMPKQQRIYSVYILASQKNGTLYIGVTGDLPTRIVQHQEQQKLGFTSRYNIGQLVWWEDFEDVQLAIQREKTMKKWVRQWKINLIETTNANWIDLSKQVLGAPNISSAY